jgi:DNA-3-methyladenine glycosylase II
MSYSSIEIDSRFPFDFRLTQAYFRRRAGELVDATDGERYRRLLSINGAGVLIEVRSAGDVSHPRLIVECLAGDPDALPAAAEAIRRAFGLDDPLDQLHEAFAGEPVLDGLLQRLPGLRLVRTQSAFEALVWAVIGQQINLTFAFRLKSMLVQELGEHLDFDGRTYWAFPQPSRVATADATSLAASGLGRRKAATLIAVARALETGELGLESLGTQPREAAEARLTALAGIGPWTAHYVLLRGLGDFGAFPASDIGLRAGAGRLYGDAGPASLARMRQLAQEWGKWRGYIAFYLWNLLAERAA